MKSPLLSRLQALEPNQVNDPNKDDLNSVEIQSKADDSGVRNKVSNLFCFIDTAVWVVLFDLIDRFDR